MSIANRTQGAGILLTLLTLMFLRRRGRAIVVVPHWRIAGCKANGLPYL